MSRNEHPAYRPLTFQGLLSRSGLALLVLLGTATAGPVRAQTKIVLRDLPELVNTDHSAIALDLIDSLMNKQGFAIIRGFYGNSGTDFNNPGQVRAFEVLPPIPSPIDGNGNPTEAILVSFEPPIANLNDVRKHQPGVQGVRVNRTLGVVSATLEYDLNAPQGWILGTFVSVFDPVAQSFDPVTGTIDTPVPPVLGGRVPEGAEFFVTFADGRKRFIAVNDYHEGTVTLIDWTDSNAPVAWAEYRLNTLPTDVCDPPPPFLVPEGNHNRGVAVVQPSAGPWKDRTLILVTLNYDPYGVDCSDDLDDDINPDEGGSDYLVILDVTGLDPAHPPPPLSSLLALDPPLRLGPSIQGTVVSVSVHPDRDVAYVVSHNQFTNSPNEDPYLYTVDLTTSPPFVTQVMIEGMDGSLAGFEASAGHSVTVRNPNLPGAVTDRLYIGTVRFPNAPDSGVLVLDITGGTNKLNPTFLRLVALPEEGGDLEKWKVRDLVAAPVNSDFLGTDLARNVLFGIVRDDLAGPPAGGRLLVLEDR